MYSVVQWSAMAVVFRKRLPPRHHKIDFFTTQTFICSKPTTETLEKNVKKFQMFKVNKKETRRTSTRSFWCL